MSRDDLLPPSSPARHAMKSGSRRFRRAGYAAGEVRRTPDASTGAGGLAGSKTVSERTMERTSLATRVQIACPICVLKSCRAALRRSSPLAEER